jgi:hypothetical protein
MSILIPIQSFIVVGGTDISIAASEAILYAIQHKCVVSLHFNMYQTGYRSVYITESDIVTDVIKRYNELIKGGVVMCNHTNIVVPFPNRTCKEHKLWVFVQCVDCGFVLFNPADRNNHLASGPVVQDSMFSPCPPQDGHAILRMP